MSNAEITKVIGDGPRCEFRYTSSGKPVLALSTSADRSGTGVVKLNGRLVELEPAAESKDGRQLGVAGALRTTIATLDADSPGKPNRGELRPADFVFEVEAKLKVGYRGYYRCIG